jgi:ABC-2 type transport system permease protein
MVATLVRLRFLILANGLKGKPWQIVAVVIGGLYGLGVLFGVVVGLIALSFAPSELARTATVLGGAATVLGWIVLSLIGPGTDQTVEPSRPAAFSAFPESSPRSPHSRRRRRGGSIRWQPWRPSSAP